MSKQSLPTPAQMQVLNELKRLGPSSAQQMAGSLRVSSMAVRHHLSILEKAGWLATTLKRGVRGRPTYLYSLTESAQAFFPNEYGDWVNRCLASLMRLNGEVKVAQVFAQMRDSAVAQHWPRMASKDLEGRVAEMAKIQSESGYMADWRRLDAKTFELTEHNCAILQVAHNCPQACDCELRMMRDLLGASVFRLEHIAKGDSCCRYVIEQVPISVSKRSRRRHPARAKIPR